MDEPKNEKFFGYEIAEGEPYILMTQQDISKLLDDFQKKLTEEGSLTGQAQDYAVSLDSKVTTQIYSWLDTVSFNSFVSDIKKQVIGQEGLEDVLLNVYLYLFNQIRNKTISNNILLAAPSGCGKTETYRALCRYFRKHIPALPVAQIDITSITPEGYAGGNSEDILRSLKDKESDGVGIIFIDEFDKCMVPHMTKGGSDLNEGVQDMLLTIVEGRDVAGIDTNKTMFIGMGSFDVIRKNRREEKQPIGFVQDHTPKRSLEHYSEIAIEDMKELGAIPELLGRFVTVVNYHKLTEEAVDSIISLNVNRLSDVFGIKIILSEETRKNLHLQANSVYGCRMFHNILHTKAVSEVKPHLIRGVKLENITITV